MLNRIIEFSLQHRLLVCVLAALAGLIGLSALMALPMDAFPDTTPVQVQVNAVSPSLSPEEIEQQITFPVEVAISGLPGLVNVRSVSKFGFSQVVATFSDETGIYLARQLVSERVQQARMPDGVERPQLGPIATGLGEVFHYVLHSENPERSLMELREWHDWVIRPELLKTPGVAEVNTWGGFEKQFHVVADPARLIAKAVTLQDLVEALRAHNRNVGGGQVVRSGEALLVQGIALTVNADQIGGIVVRSSDGVPVRVRDVAEVELGHEIRRGAATAGGRGEVVLGLGFMLMGANSRDVTQALSERLAEVQKVLPPDIQVETLYDRTELVNKVLRTVQHNLLAGALLVVSVLFLFLGNLRAGLIVASAIPLSFLFAGTLMLQAGIAASLLSLGAMDFGLVVDSSVIVVENCVRHAAQHPQKPRLQMIRDAAVEVRKPTIFGELIILIVFVPILALEGVEGKMFRPMALTMIFALLGSLIFSVTLMPVLASLFLSKRARVAEPWVMRRLQSLYREALGLVLRFRRTTAAIGALVLAVAAVLGSRLGAEFMPQLNEGALVANVIRLSGVSLDQAVRGNLRIENLLIEEFPHEIERVWSRVGTAEVATDPMGLELSDVFMALKPRREWRRAETQGELVVEIERVLGDLPGMNIAYTQPIEMRLSEMTAGIRSDVGIKVYGDDFAELTRISDAIQKVLNSIEGTADLATEQMTGQPVLQIRLDPDAAARLGLAAQPVLDVIEAVGGIPAGEVREGQRRFPLIVRLPDLLRTNPEALAGTLVPTPGGAVVSLASLAEIQIAEGPATIQREWSRRRLTVQANVRGRDVAGYLDEARREVQAVAMPDGYTVEWGGQFEHMERANRRFMIIIPAAIGLIFLLLYASLGSVRDVMLVATGVPFGMVGGIAALSIRGMPLSVSATIGFIALSGVAMLNGLVLLTFIRQKLLLGGALEDAVMAGCQLRLRPVLMTALVAAIGFVPMAVNTGVGAEIQSPLATVVIGGIITDTLLTLLVLPVLCVIAGTGKERG